MTQSIVHKTKLNQKQIHLLKLLFKFRFISSKQLATYKKVRKSAIDKSLIVLLDRGFIGRHYDKSYKLRGKGAAYYLAPLGLRHLRDEHDFNANVLHAMYKNKAASEAFVEHHLHVLDIYLSLRDDQPNAFTIFSKTELYDYEHFPQPRPDLFLTRNSPLPNGHNDYFLEAFTEQQTPLFAIKKRLTALFEHHESGDWEAEEKTAYPALLIVCRDGKLEAKVRAHVSYLLEGRDTEALHIYTTTKKLLDDRSAHTWRSIHSDKKFLPLS